VTAVIEVFNFN